MKYFILIIILFSSLQAGWFGSFFSSAKKVKLKKPLNYKYRNSAHPITKVRYNRLGYPIFKKSANCKIPSSLLFENDTTQFNNCNARLLKGINKSSELRKRFSAEQINEIQHNKTPTGYVWHHNQKSGVLELVDRELHKKTTHTGGRSIWGGGQDNR
jgi:hypothetical protein